eukprot:3848734-Amphidinium_carterae.1
MPGGTLVSKDISLLISLEVVGGYPASIDVSVLQVGFHPPDALTWLQRIQRAVLKVTVTAFGPPATCLQ